MIKKQIISSGMWLGSANVFQAFAQILTFSILSRILEPSDFGLVAILIIILNFINIFNELGVGASIIHIEKLDKKVLQNAYSISLYIGLLITAIYYLIIPYVLQYFNAYKILSTAYFLGVYFPIKSFTIISEATLQRNLNFKDISIIQFSSYIFGYAFFSILFAYLGFGYNSIVIGYIAQLLILSVIYTIKIKPIYSLTLDSKILKQITKYGTGISLGTIINYFAEQIDIFIIGRLYNKQLLGIYSRSFQLYAMPARLAGSLLDKISFPVLSKNKYNIPFLQRSFKISILVINVIVLPGSIILSLLSNEVVNIVMGKSNWEPAKPVFSILILGLAFRIGAKLNKSFLKSLSKVYQSAIIQFFYLLVLASLILILGSTKILGVATAVIVATVILYFMLSIIIIKRISLDLFWFFKIHLLGLLISLLYYLFFNSIIQFLRVNIRYDLIIILIPSILQILIALILYKTYKDKVTVFS